VQVGKFTPILKTQKSKVRAMNKNAEWQSSKVGWSSKRERAKSRVDEEIKSVLGFEKKIVVTSSYILTSRCC
jgi:hypothetical protein